MKHLKFILLGVLILGLCSMAATIDPRASLQADTDLAQTSSLHKELLTPAFQDSNKPMGTRAVLLAESFDTGTFPPTGWTSHDVDVSGTQWASITGHYHSSPESATHTYGSGMQDGWLISPAIPIPDTGSYFLSFWDSTDYVDDYYRHSIKINTSSNDPADPNWVTLWEPSTATGAWTNVLLPLSDYNDSTVHIAFQYEGDYADSWYIDDVYVTTGDRYNLSMLDTVGGTTIPAAGTYQYYEDTEVHLYATPGYGYTWDSWQGEVANAANHKTTITMNADRTVQAGFISYGLENLVSQPEIGGNAYTSALDGDIDYEAAENFSVSADKINKVVVQGLTLINGENGWYEWTPNNTEPFIVRFYDQSPTTEPDWANPLQVFNVTGKVFSLGLLSTWNHTGYKVELDLPIAVNLNAGWVSVQIDVDNGAGGWFLQLTSGGGTGDGMFYQRTDMDGTIVESDLMLELWGRNFDIPADVPTVVGDLTVSSEVDLNINANIDIDSPIVAALPNYGSLNRPVVLGLTGSGMGDLSLEVGPGTWYGILYYAGSWHQGDPYPLTPLEASTGIITFAGVDYDAKGDVIIVLNDGMDLTLPVTLSSFTAVLTADLQVKIAWISESETGHAGYNVIRSEVSTLSTAMRINDAIIDNGTANGSQMAYLFTDAEVDSQTTYYYWLESVSLSGESDYYGPLMVTVYAAGEEPGIPEITVETKLFSAFPNPFNPSTNLRYSMKEAGDLAIEVYNVKGQLLRSFNRSHDQAGYYQISWDGRDANGSLAGTGVYFYRMSSGTYSSTRKMIMAK